MKNHKDDIYKNSSKKLKIKYPEGDTLFAGCSNGSVQEISIKDAKTTVNDHGYILKKDVFMMNTTIDKKSQFVCDLGSCFKELDISTGKQVNSCKVKSALWCVVTHDNNFLITVTDGKNCVLTKWSVRTKKQLHTWNCGVDKWVYSQSCNQDSKYQLIGYESGYLTIYDLQKHQKLKNIQVMPSHIVSMAFSRDNKSVFISDYHGNIKIIGWTADAGSGNYFFTQDSRKKTFKKSLMCLSKDEKYLLYGSNKLLSIFQTNTRGIIKEFELENLIKSITLIRGGKTAIIAEQNGNLSYIYLNFIELSVLVKNITNFKILNRMIAI